MKTLSIGLTCWVLFALGLIAQPAIAQRWAHMTNDVHFDVDSFDFSLQDKVVVSVLNANVDRVNQRTEIYTCDSNNPEYWKALCIYEADDGPLAMQGDIIPSSIGEHVRNSACAVRGLNILDTTPEKTFLSVFREAAADQENIESGFKAVKLFSDRVNDMADEMKLEEMPAT